MVGVREVVASPATAVRMLESETPIGMRTRAGRRLAAAAAAGFAAAAAPGPAAVSASGPVTAAEEEKEERPKKRRKWKTKTEVWIQGEGGEWERE